MLVHSSTASVNAQVPEAQSWIEAYKPLAKAYYADCRRVDDIEKSFPTQRTRRPRVLAEKVRSRTRVAAD